VNVGGAFVTSAAPSIKIAYKFAKEIDAVVSDESIMCIRY
jgi:hypothetical protein